MKTKKTLLFLMCAAACALVASTAIGCQSETVLKALNDAEHCDAAGETAAVAHTYGEATVVTAATCTTEGKQTKTCADCGYTKTEVIPATGHTYADVTVVWDYANDTATVEGECACGANIADVAVVTVSKVDTSTCEAAGTVTLTATVTVDGEAIEATDATVSYDGTKKDHYHNYWLTDSSTHFKARTAECNCEGVAAIQSYAHEYAYTYDFTAGAEKTNRTCPVCGYSDSVNRILNNSEVKASDSTNPTPASNTYYINTTDEWGQIADVFSTSFTAPTRAIYTFAVAESSFGKVTVYSEDYSTYEEINYMDYETASKSVSFFLDEGDVVNVDITVNSPGEMTGASYTELYYAVGLNVSYEPTEFMPGDDATLPLSLNTGFWEHEFTLAAGASKFVTLEHLSDGAYYAKLYTYNEAVTITVDGVAATQVEEDYDGDAIWKTTDMYRITSSKPISVVITNTSDAEITTKLGRSEEQFSISLKEGVNEITVYTEEIKFPGIITVNCPIGGTSDIPAGSKVKVQLDEETFTANEVYASKTGASYYFPKNYGWTGTTFKQYTDTFATSFTLKITSNKEFTEETITLKFTVEVEAAAPAATGTKDNLVVGVNSIVLDANEEYEATFTATEAGSYTFSATGDCYISLEYVPNMADNISESGEKTYTLTAGQSFTIVFMSYSYDAATYDFTITKE